MKQIIPALLLLALCACGTNKKELMRSVKENELLLEKTVNDYTFRLQYMPPVQVTEDTSLSYFRFHVSNNSGVSLKAVDDIHISYGLDTLFTVVNATDTIHPVDINRIANGNIGGAEYMLVFDKQGLHSLRECKLLFKDWLFTHQMISFPLSGKAIVHVDSLSLKI